MVGRGGDYFIFDCFLTDGALSKFCVYEFVWDTLKSLKSSERARTINQHNY